MFVNTWLLCSPSCASLRLTHYWHTVWESTWSECQKEHLSRQLRLSLSSPLFWPTSSMDETLLTHSLLSMPSNKGHLRVYLCVLKIFLLSLSAAPREIIKRIHKICEKETSREPRAADKWFNHRTREIVCRSISHFVYIPSIYLFLSALSAKLRYKLYLFSRSASGVLKVVLLYWFLINSKSISVIMFYVASGKINEMVIN